MEAMKGTGNVGIQNKTALLLPVIVSNSQAVVTFASFQ